MYHAQVALALFLCPRDMPNAHCLTGAPVLFDVQTVTLMSILTMLSMNAQVTDAAACVMSAAVACVASLTTWAIYAGVFVLVVDVARRVFT